jgi:RNA polymerase sigma factor (sigma-70 family)
MPSGFLRRVRGAVLTRDGGGLSDAQLLSCFVERRDAAAFEALLRRHGPMVLGTCRRILGDTHEADDAFQAVFLVFVRKAASVASRETVGGWLYGVAYRTALAARTRRRRHRAREKQVEAMPQPTVEPEDTWRELKPLLDKELSRLPEKFRVPVVLCDLEGLPRRQVARQLGLPEGTLSSRLHTAPRTLAQRLSRYGFAVSGGALAAALTRRATAVVPSPLVASTVKVAGGQAVAATAAAALSKLPPAKFEAAMRRKGGPSTGCSTMLPTDPKPTWPAARAAGDITLAAVNGKVSPGTSKRTVIMGPTTRAGRKGHEGHGDGPLRTVQPAGQHLSSRKLALAAGRLPCGRRRAALSGPRRRAGAGGGAVLAGLAGLPGRGGQAAAGRGHARLVHSAPAVPGPLVPDLGGPGAAVDRGVLRGDRREMRQPPAGDRNLS